MLLSLKWLNSMLRPGDLTAEEADRVLTAVGFPIESREEVQIGVAPGSAAPGGHGAQPSTDVRLDMEVTSNRGDMLCHAGAAREIAAATGREFVAPPEKLVETPGGESARGATSVENRAKEACPLFTARVIRGVKVGASPKWLAERLESIGQRSINNVVDASNYVLFELGHPTHAFDMAKLSNGGRKIVVRWAKDGERLVTLDEKERKLKGDELVVADEERAVGLAGVMGGLETAVTEGTRDVLLEAATWDPATVRRASRRHQLRSDASHRYERYVDARMTAFASARLAGLIAELTGGKVLAGCAQDGVELKKRTVVSMRPARARALLGIEIPDAQMPLMLAGFGIEATAKGGALECVIPADRPDLTREVDLIEEVGRARGLDDIEVRGSLRVDIKPPQERERAVREVAGALTARGFYETVTFSFLSREEAGLWLPQGMKVLAVDEERRKGEPALRPSVVPSLLKCAMDNRHAQNHPEGGIRLFEMGAVFAEGEKGETVERRNLAILAEGERGDAQGALRVVKGAIEGVVRAMRGAGEGVRVEGMGAWCESMDGRACAGVRAGESCRGYVGLVTESTRARFDLEHPVAVAEIGLDALVGMYPASGRAEALASYPPVERDVSLVVDEAVSWARVEEEVRGARLERLEGVSFVGAYRGKQVGKGKKSVTLRLVFRDRGRTLRREEVDGQVEALVARCGERLGAERRV